MKQPALARLIQRFRSGMATPEEKGQLEKIWLKAMEDTSFLDSLSDAERDELKRSIFLGTRQKIERLTRSQKTVFLQSWLFKAAAIALFFLTVSMWLYRRAGSMAEIHTGYGERLSVTLPDESTVILNGNSILRYNDHWSEEDTREVWIDGEGFFAVQHTQDHQKFIVHASDRLNVEVLGTKFNVKSRRQRGSEVMLTEGKVKLDLPNNTKTASVFLKPGELATMRNQHLSKRVAKQQQYTSWVENKLFFDRTPLSDVAALLYDTYGFEVVFSESELKDRVLSGEISSATADDILYAIAETFNLTVHREGQVVTISSNIIP